MTDLVPQILLVTSWISNKLNRRKRKKEAYQAAADTLFFRPAELTDLERLAQLEEAGYPPDEAATREALRYRLEQAPGLFLAAMQNERLIGFTCGTLTAATSLTHESMSRHDPNGTTLCIHSVCVDEHERRKKVAQRMLKAYLTFVSQTSPKVSCVRLICKEQLLPLYRSAGFESVGPSKVVHGKDPWIEMVQELTDESGYLTK